jgi:hypothetical protein
MRCECVPEGYLLSAQRNPLKRLLRWAWRASAALVVAGAAATVFAVVEASADCGSGGFSRRTACVADRDDAETLAWLVGSTTVGLVLIALVLAACCWLARKYRTCIKPASQESPNSLSGTGFDT